MSAKRAGFTLFQLLVILAILALLFALFLPAAAKMRAQAARQQSQNKLQRIALACHSYHDNYNTLPPGVDANGFGTAAYLLPYLDQTPLYKKIDFGKSVADEANKKWAVPVKIFLNPQDPIEQVNKDFGVTNYLFCAGSQYDLKDNNGVFYRNSKIKFTAVADGLSNTLMVGETLKGDGGTKATDVHRQHVQLKKDALKGLKDESGVQDFKDDKNIAANRCQSWMDGRFLRGTFTGTRTLNDEKPDVDCGGVGGLSALRSLIGGSNVGMCDGSARFVSDKISLKTWKNAAGRNDGEPLGADWD